MKGCLLRFYMHENRKHGHILLYEWLLEQAKWIGILDLFRRENIHVVCARLEAEIGVINADGK